MTPLSILWQYPLLYALTVNHSPSVPQSSSVYNGDNKSCADS